MNERTKSVLKLAGTILVFLLAAGFVLNQFRNLSQRGDAGTMVWFYDQSEHRLYAVPQDTIPPHAGIGGKKGDGVRAIVTVLRSDQLDASKRHIAYLETYTPELKTILENARTARASGRRFEGKLPSQDSDFFQDNTMVKRTDDSQWYPSSSAEGQKIMSAWRLLKDSNGQTPILSVPD